MHRGHVLALIFVLAATSVAQPPPPSSSLEQLATFGWLIGSWNGSGEWSGTPFTDRYVFRYEHGGCFLAHEYEMTVAGQVAWRDTGMIAYDLDAKEFAGFVFGMDGSLGRSRMSRVDENTWRSEGRTSGASPFKAYKGEMKRLSADEFSMGIEMTDPPMPKMVIVYKRQGAAAVAATVTSSFDRDDAPRCEFDVPIAWKAGKPGSRMQLTSYTLPGEKPATCIVYFFGAGSGGGVQANLDRWTGQFRDAKFDKPTTIELKSGVKATILDVSGNYSAETRPGSGERVDEPNWRMLAAVLEVTGGPLFIKAVGPAATIAAAEAGFNDWIKSFRPKN